MFLFLYQLFNNDYFVLLMNNISFLLKIALFLHLFTKTYIQHKQSFAALFLLLTFFSGAFVDFGWILGLMNDIGYRTITNSYIFFMSRVAWTFFIIQYQSMILLLDFLINKNCKAIFKNNLIFILASCLFALSFIVLAFVTWQPTIEQSRPPIEYLMKHLCSIYLLLILMPINLWRIFSNLRTQKIPVIIKQQSKTLLLYLVIPYLLSDLVNMNPIRTNYFAPLIESQAFTGFSTLILTYLLYFCIRRMLNIRFLNFKPQIKPAFTDSLTNGYFKEISTILSMVNHTYEIAPIVERFLDKVLHMQEKKMHLFIRTCQNSNNMNAPTKREKTDPMHPIMATIETALLGPTGKRLLAYFKKEQIVLLDELEFVNFYDEDPFLHGVLELLYAIDCCMLLPIFQKDDLVGYIVILNHAHKSIVYASTDKDMLVVFANYLGTIIGSMQYKRMKFLADQNSMLLNEAYFKDQYISHVKESIKSFIFNQHSNKIALFFYKNNVFTLSFASNDNGLTTALSSVNLNTQQGDPINKKCRALVQLALKQKTIQTTLLKIDAENILRAIAFPDKQSNQVFLLITIPAVSDLVTDHLIHAQSINDWDSILYLQTTDTGRLIDNLLPGWSKTMLSYKIDLLKSILSKKAFFVDCQPTDIPMLVNMIHTASKRKNSHTIDILTKPQYETELFGLNPLYGDAPDPLLQTMHLGTLFIDNIHELSLHAQEKLATFIEHGHFTRLESNMLITCDVQILLATSLQCTENNNAYSYELCTILENQRVTLPTPADLDEDTLLELIEGYSTQAMAQQGSSHLFALSDREKKALVSNKAISLTQLKQRISLLIATKNNKIDPEIVYKADPALLFTDQTLVQAARLGKNTLKDKRLMLLLWHKFNKNQNKIATFLGVNRTSVCRRMKIYDDFT